MRCSSSLLLNRVANERCLTLRDHARRNDRLSIFALEHVRVDVDGKRDDIIRRETHETHAYKSECNAPEGEPENCTWENEVRQQHVYNLDVILDAISDWC